jgi:hypothetical protein
MRPTEHRDWYGSLLQFLAFSGVCGGFHLSIRTYLSGNSNLWALSDLLPQKVLNIAPFLLRRDLVASAIVRRSFKPPKPIRSLSSVETPPSFYPGPPSIGTKCDVWWLDKLKLPLAQIRIYMHQPTLHIPTYSFAQYRKSNRDVRFGKKSASIVLA